MNNFFKRLFDIIVSSVCLVIFSPILIILSIMIYFKLGSPVIFKQERPGKNGKIFKMLKFRTMLNTVDEHGELLPNEQRLTPFGNMLRKTSLDELPEFINVLKGDMSLVGPRPLLCEYLELYTPEQNRRHEVKPGITGYAQVNGRNSIGWEERFKLDVYYVDHYNFLLDLKILFMTVFKVFKRDGIGQTAENTTMEKFKGSNI